MKEYTNKSRMLAELSWSQVGIIVLVPVAGFFLWAEHKVHILGFLPYLIFLLSPLIHIFMHRGHGKNGKGNSSHLH